MSQLSEQIKVALIAKAKVPQVLNLAKGGVFYGESNSDIYPVLIIEKASNVPTWAMGLTLQIEESLWMLKVYTDRESSSPNSPIALAESIIAEAVTQIGETLTLSSGQCRGVMRMGDLPEIKQLVSNRNIYMTGVMLRIWAV